MGLAVNTNNCGGIRYSSWGKVKDYLDKNKIKYSIEYDECGDASYTIKYDTLRSIDMKKFKDELDDITCFSCCIEECLKEKKDLMIW